ncbi:MAG: M1 family peptidase, partial [Bacteroidota bacterium]
MNLYKVPLIICFILFSQTAWSQLLDDASPDFTKKDSLRGSISKYRIYDVKFYDLSLDINLDQKTIRGSNKIHFLATTDLKRVQVDLFEGLNIDGIQDENGKELVFKREYDAIFIDFPDPLIEGGIYWINVQYSGAPTAAKRPPWDGGFAWSKDSNGDHWVGVACQGVGASLWWPNKDHLSDEPDSMRISVTVPKDYINVSNGTLRNTKRRGKKTEYEWFVANPINNYNVSLNIAKYDHFSEIYQNEVGERLNIDYYVLPENLDKAKTQFKDTRPMIEAFEHYFGPYAFYEDGFKMIDVPYLGMEHQSAVAYGNSYLKGYNG